MLASTAGTFTTPVVLSYALALEEIVLPIGDIIFKLVCSILIPLFIGKVLQELPIGDFAIRRACARHSAALAYASNALLVAIPWMKLSATAHRGTLARANLGEILLMCLWFIVVHLIFLVSSLQLSPPPRRASPHPHPRPLRTFSRSCAPPRDDDAARRRRR